MNTSTYRLPTHASPRRYNVKLDARLGREEFFGQVAIALHIHAAKDTLDLHSRDLTISKAELLIEGKTLAAEVTSDPENETVVLRFSQDLAPGAATLVLEFSGKVSQTLRGLYLAQDRPEQALCTQCEATDARAIFPCFDEPTFKAQFAFEITTDPDVVVLSNGPLVSVTENGAGKTWKFAATKTMSSYLVALVIGDMASAAEQIVHGVPLRVWTMRGKEGLGAFALDYTAKLLPWYEEYFGAPYHFDKYDQAAVPGFSAGAMENSGLVIFRQELLIMSQESASWRQEKFIALVIAHEFAHMWFGNLVTMQWWDDLWLNEAFAEWISHRVTSDISPHYRIWDDFQGNRNYTLADDALESTHPIYSSVKTPAQAQELFDSITYLKGCAVLRMLENFLGFENFRAGLRTYMREFAERNARGADLWRHLQAASQQPVAQIVESWILQSGYPYVTVNFETLDGQPQIQLKQERFFSNPQTPKENGQLWQVPMVIRHADDAGVHTTRHVLNSAEEIFTLPVGGDLRWCYANADEIGFYRQHLNAALLTKILANLEQLNPSEQMGLLADQWALTRSGRQNIAQFLDVLTALAARSDNYNLLFEIVEHLHTLERMVEDIGVAAVVDHFRGWVTRLFKDRLEVLGFEPHPGEATETLQQRISAVNAMTKLARRPEAVKQVRLWAEREAQDPRGVDPNLAATFVAVNAQFGDAGTFKKHVDIYLERKANGSPPQEVTRYLYGFASFRAPELVTQTLSLLDEGIAPREAWGPLLGRLLDARYSQVAAWEYLKTNWATIKEMGIGTPRLIKGAGQLPSSMRGDLVAFYEANAKGIADMAYAQAVETMDLLAEFQARTKNDLIQWLSHARQ
jgi:puromycin-sensitive aminopeptidase